MGFVRQTAVLVIVSVLACGGIACRSDGDRLEVPTPDPREYVDLRFTALNATDVDHVILGGYLSQVDRRAEGILLRTENGGDRWYRVGSETFNFDDFIVQCIHFNDSLRGWVAGVRTIDGETLPTVIRTDDGGGHWREAVIPHDRKTIVTTLADLRFESDETGRVTIYFSEPASGELTANVYESTDGGHRWIIKDFIDPAAAGPTDPGEQYVSEFEAYRIDRPLPNGTQILYFTGTKGQTWVPRSQFHVTNVLSWY